MNFGEFNDICERYADKVYDASGKGRLKELIFGAIREALTIRREQESKSWEEWIASEEGQILSRGETYGEFLEARLKRAFNAGAKTRAI